MGLGLGEADRIAGFLFFGSPPAEPPAERDRPERDQVVRWFKQRGDVYRS